MTDVPGHTLGIVPLLAAAGVHFLHLGVKALRRRDVAGSCSAGGHTRVRVVVMYQRHTVATQFPEGFEQASGLPIPKTIWGRKGCSRSPTS